MTISIFKDRDLEWVPDVDLSDPDRPVRSETAVLGGDADTGRVDFITRWEPNSYCSLHRHLAETKSWVIAGELVVEEMDGTLRRRPAGHHGVTPAGRIHWEKAGPEGCTILFSLQSGDGRAFEAPGRDGAASIFIGVGDMLAGALP